MLRIGFIGVGNMGSALALSIAKSDKVSLISLANKTESKSLAVADKIGDVAKCTTNKDVAENCDFIFLGVKPNVVESVLSEISDILAKRHESGEKVVLVSMAAGLKIETQQKMAGGDYPTIRIMPNTPVSIGCGVTLLCNSKEVESSTLSQFKELMDYTGDVVDLDEGLFDAGTALSGCGPAFVYMFADALAARATELGIEANVAKKLALSTISGASRLASQQNEQSLEDLKRAVCSPGGATLKGVEALDEGGFSQLVGEALDASFRRSREMAGD